MQIIVHTFKALALCLYFFSSSLSCILKITQRPCKLFSTLIVFKFCVKKSILFCTLITKKISAEGYVMEKMAERAIVEMAV